MFYIKKYIVQVGLVGISLLVYLNSTELSDSARAFPRAMAGSLLVLVICLMASTIMKEKKEGSGTAAKNDNPGSSLNVKTMTILGGFIVFNVLFVWLLPIIGFEITGFLYILGGIIMLGGAAAKRFWWVAVVLPVLLGVVFRTLLDLRLPLFPFLS